MGQRLLSMLVDTGAYAVGGALISIVLTFVLLAVTMFIGPLRAMHEIEEHNNGAVGAAFFVVSSLASFASVMMIWTPGSDAIVSGIPWLVLALVLGSVVYICIMTPILLFFCRNNLPKEGPVTFVRREIFEDKNVGLTLFMGGIMMNVFVPALASALSA